MCFHVVLPLILAAAKCSHADISRYHSQLCVSILYEFPDYLRTFLPHI